MAVEDLCGIGVGASPTSLDRSVRISISTARAWRYALSSRIWVRSPSP